GYRTPTKVYAHGFLTVDGQKMSKSRGTFLTAESYLQHGLNPEWLRYYYAGKLNATMEDIDLNLEDFVAHVNSDLGGKYVNIAARCAGFVTKRFGGKLGEVTRVDPTPYLKQTLEDETARELERKRREQPAGDIVHAAVSTARPGYDMKDTIEWFRNQGDEIRNAYEQREFGHALRLIMRLADIANRYVDHQKPWDLAKQANAEVRLHQVCSYALNLFRLLTLYLKPVLPKVAADVEAFLGIDPLRWQDAGSLLPAGHAINPYQHLMTRIDPKQVQALVAANRETLAPPTPAPAVTSSAKADASVVSIEDFAKLDLRVARIVSAELVDGADKLLKLTVDLGGEQRTLFAGIRSAYDPAQLVGRLTVVVANLAPRKMRFG